MGGAISNEPLPLLPNLANSQSNNAKKSIGLLLDDDLEKNSNPILPQTNIMDTKENSLLLQQAKEKRWRYVIGTPQKYATSYLFFTKAIDPKNGRSILHYACDQERNKDATYAVKMILSWPGFTVEEKDKKARKKFLNKEDNEHNVAIQLAAERKNRQLVRLLIESGADVDLPKKPTNWSSLWSSWNKMEAIQYIYKNMPYVIEDQLEVKLKLKEDKDDHSKDMYDVEWDFTPVTGVLAQDIYDKEDQATDNDSEALLKSQGQAARKRFECQTLVLSTALQQNSLKRSEILLHPLVRLFLHYKHEKFERWIIGSMVYHIFWSILSILFMVCYAPFPATSIISNISSPEETVNKGPGNATVKVSSVVETLPEWISIASRNTLLAFWILAVGKELTEMITCPNTKFYFRQFENIGQLLLILFLPATWISTLTHNNDLTNFIATIGILIAGLLVLGQLNKTKLLGIYVEMMEKVVKNLVKFLIFFFPLLATFASLFRLLLPNRDEFGFPYFVKVSAMMTGEIEYESVFHNPDESLVPLPLLTKVVFIFFVLLVVIVLQNLLIGLTLSDIQELKKIATENHIAKQLEQICLIENFLVSPPVQGFLRMVDRKAVLLESLMVAPKGTKKLGDLDENLQQMILMAIEGNPDRFQESH